MARAREMMIKCGWTEGKGLGKDECGITEPVKLATTQNKAGIGYSETNPWWEKMFDDAVKNVKVTSHGDEVSLSLVSDTNASRPEGEYMINGRKFTPKGHPKNWNDWKTFVKSEVTVDDQKLTLTNPYSCGTFTSVSMRKPSLDQTTSACSGEMVHEMGHNLTSSGGKLERIAEQDRILLNKSLSDTTLTRENDTGYRMTNVESDVEEEHESSTLGGTLRIDGMQFNPCLSRTTKKRHRKKVNMLATQLGACNLEESKEKQDLGLRTICPRLKKNKEKKLTKSTLLTCLATDTSDQVTVSQVKSSEVDNKFHANKFQMSNSCKEIDRVYKLINILQKAKSVSEKDSVGHKIELSPELKNSTEGNKVTEMRHKDCIIDLGAEKQDYDRHSTRKSSVWKLRRALKLDIPENPGITILSHALLGPRKELFYAAKEYGTTEPATTQNKAGIGDGKIDTWEKVFDDARKDVKVASRGDEVSSSLVSDPDAWRSGDGCTISGRKCSPRIYRTEELKNCKHPDIREVNSREEIKRINNHILRKPIRRRTLEELRKERLKEILSKAVRRKRLNREVNSVINDLTSFSLTEEVKADAIKKKPTQTHRTSV